MGAIGSSNTHTGLQAYDSSDNSANNFNINPYGGRVSIGTSAPVSPGTHNSRLAVEGTDYHSSTISISANSADSNGAYLMFSKSRDKKGLGGDVNGYYAKANFKNNSTKKAELFAVSSEITINSK